MVVATCRIPDTRQSSMSDWVVESWGRLARGWTRSDEQKSRHNGVIIENILGDETGFAVKSRSVGVVASLLRLYFVSGLR